MRCLVVVALLGASAVQAQQYYNQPNKVFNINTMSSASYARSSSVSYSGQDAFAMGAQIQRQVQAQIQQTQRELGMNQQQVVYVDRIVQQPQQPVKIVYVDRPVPQPAAQEPEDSRSDYIKECQRYGFSKSRCSNIWDETPVEAAPKPVAKSTYRPARDEEIVTEYKEPPAPVTFKHKDTKVINRDDIQLTEEQDRLTKLGIPIISGVRSAAKQESLKDHQGPNGQWYTAGGMPVAEHSLHTTGAAIDCGPLNKAQRKILAENGWYQPIPQQDPNHWEKINPT